MFQVSANANPGPGDLLLELTVLSISHTDTLSNTINCQSLPDAACQAGNGTITVIQPNQAPAALADNLALSEGGWVNVMPGGDLLSNGQSSLLDNDMDPDSDELSIDTTPLVPPQRALAFALSANGAFSYTHDGSETLSDSFTYQVCDDGLPVMCDQATVNLSIEAVNDRPEPMPDFINVSAGGTATSLVGGNTSVLDNDSDVELDNLAASTAALLEPLFASAFVLNQDGSFSYTHDGSNNTCDHLIYEVCDDGMPMACSEASVRIQVASRVCPGLPSVLLIDDDDNTPDIGQPLASALARLGVTATSDQTLGDAAEPDFLRMVEFDMVLWLTGDADAPTTGPSPNTELEISRYLAGGGCFVISAENWLAVRGQSNDLPTPLMSELGLASGVSDQQQGSVSGGGPDFSGLDFTLDFSRLSAGADLLNASPDAQLSFSGDAGGAALQRRGQSGDSIYFGFPLTAIPEVDQLLVLERVLNYCAERIFVQGFENL